MKWKWNGYSAALRCTRIPALGRTPVSTNFRLVVRPIIIIRSSVLIREIFLSAVEDDYKRLRIITLTMRVFDRMGAILGCNELIGHSLPTDWADRHMLYRRFGIMHFKLFAASGWASLTGGPISLTPCTPMSLLRGEVRFQSFRHQPRLQVNINSKRKSVNFTSYPQHGLRTGRMKRRRINTYTEARRAKILKITISLISHLI